MTLTTKTIEVNGRQEIVIGTKCSKKEAKANGFEAGKKDAYVVSCSLATGYGYDFNDALNNMTTKFLRAI